MSDDFGKEVRDLWQQADEADRENREEAIRDLEFAAGEHWDAQVRTWREQQGIAQYGFPLPCLTINTIPQFVGQVIGDRRANERSIKVLPKEDGDKDVADVLGEMIRSVEVQSRANRVYNMAFEQMVTCGIGNFRVDIDYAYEDAFDRDLFIRSIPHPFGVRWDPLAADATARDAQWCFAADEMSEADYIKKFPGAMRPSLFDSEMGAGSWHQRGRVQVPEYWRMEERERTIAMLSDGRIEDVTDLPRSKWLGRVAKDQDGKPVIREKAKVRFAVMVVTNGVEALSDPFELRIPRLPIIRCQGREVWTGERRVRFGLVRFARDPMRLKDYYRSIVAEKLMLAPRSTYIASASAIRGREKDWKNAQVYNDNAQPPVPITQSDMGALLSEAANCAQDMKDVTGLHDASLGIRSNETSGIAIQRRQQEGDIAAIVYHDNMDSAQQEAGELCVCLLPVVNDTARTVRRIGPDGIAKLQRINDPNDPDSVDLGVGRYDVAISTGPSYMTRRQEAADDLMQLAQGNPEVVAKAGDLIVKALDIPDGDQIAERLAPAGAVSQEDMTPEQQAAAAQAQQEQQMLARLAMRAKVAEVAKAEAEAEEAQAKAEEAKARARKVGAEATDLEAQNAIAGAHLAAAANDASDAEDQAEFVV